MMARVLIAICALTLPGMSAFAQSDRVVALVVSVGQGVARADAVQAQLQVMGAETLRSTNPNDAALRAMLKRFADEAAASRTAFVYLDTPAVIFESREFVIPDGVGLRRSTDLFTQGIPLQAFARAAAQAKQGGAVIATIGSPPEALPDGLATLQKAPESVAGSSPILVAEYGFSDPVMRVMASAVRDDEIEIGAMFRRMQAGRGITVSHFPETPIYLRSPVVAGEPSEVLAGQVDVEQPGPGERETLEELAILEQSLSRSAKRAIQQLLRDQGYYNGLVDGIFGPQTRAAINSFQADRSERSTGLLTRRQLLDLRKSG